MKASRYRALIHRKALLASKAALRKVTAVELFAGTGGLTSIYERHFEQVITNDINPEAMYFIDQVIPILGKIDLVDFDCYGCPAYEVHKFFDLVEHKMCPIVIGISDGMGQRLKRIRDEDGIIRRYLVEPDQFDLRYSWRVHPRLLDNLMKVTAEKHRMQCKTVSIFQSTNMNASFGVWLLT